MPLSYAQLPVPSSRTAPTTSALLGFNRSDLPSFGSDDVFTKSGYNQGKPLAYPGLTDTLQPGAYTPRKQLMEREQQQMQQMQQMGAYAGGGGERAPPRWRS